MVKTSGRILKSEDVVFGGQYHLGMGKVQIGRGESPGKSAVSAPAQVRILENHPNYAVLEITCTCGAKICVRCEYANSRTPDKPKGKDGTDIASGSIN
ncbi:MAG: hypothetical protein JXM79_07675 [Sedimentisphaerales bacterium]|nr:hypothetical protein [Sedimentisphaerales bacterium]